jgi:hypothetical protein
MLKKSSKDKAKALHLFTIFCLAVAVTYLLLGTVSYLLLLLLSAGR